MPGIISITGCGCDILFTLPTIKIKKNLSNWFGFLTHLYLQPYVATFLHMTFLGSGITHSYEWNLMSVLGCQQRWRGLQLMITDKHLNDWNVWRCGITKKWCNQTSMEFVCIVGNVGTRFWHKENMKFKKVLLLLLHWYDSIGVNAKFVQVTNITQSHQIFPK